MKKFNYFLLQFELFKSRILYLFKIYQICICYVFLFFGRFVKVYSMYCNLINICGHGLTIVVYEKYIQWFYTFAPDST